MIAKKLNIKHGLYKATRDEKILIKAAKGEEIDE